MGNKKATKRLTVRRAATFLAVLGALVMSSGVALMATATSANADPNDKVVVCKYVSTPGGQLDHIVIVSASTILNDKKIDPPWDGSTFPFQWEDAQGQEGGSIAIRFATDGEQAHDVSPSECTQTVPETPVATASVTFTDPTCDNGNTASFSTSGENVTFDNPTATPGASITVTATATGDAQFDGGGTTATFDHTFTAAADCSSTVVSPPKKHHTQSPTPTTTVTPTVVHAGLAGATTQDMRSEQGLALMFAGMVMLVAAGGLGLRLRGSAARI
ncbi:MAG TPA: hypothetical protein VFE07_07300 [Marmoricola sp.]|nr:hypothetical protein [Marmoricola sp.]